MTPDQVGHLITYIATIDPRQARRGEDADKQLEQWCDLLSHIPAQAPGWDAKHIVRDHVLNSAYGILPVDIGRAWADYRRRQLARDNAEAAPPRTDPDRPLDYARELRAGRTAVAHGRIEPRTAVPTPARMTDEDVYACIREGDLRELMRLKQAERLAENTRNRALVLKHPDLVERLKQLPIDFHQPTCWSGFIPDDGAARRDALTALVTEAQGRP